MHRHNPARSVPGRNGLAGRSFVALIVLGLAVSAVALSADRPSGPQVTVKAGLLEGKTATIDGVVLNEFQGIPYAAPPVGALRWKPPQPAAAWRGVRAARQFGPRCMQLPLFEDMVFRSDGMSEDCLYLNVWAPAKAKPGLPVLVYFFGGGFVAGDGSEHRYDGASLASKGIVTVTVNYRLSVFGFLATTELAAESPHHAAGNYGLLDQAAALRWVHDNIGRFGGDPARITIGGESAGSISVSAQMASPLSKHLIAGAIGESGALIAPIAPRPLAEAQEAGHAYMAAVGASSLNALRAMPAETLLKATRPQGGAPVSFAPDVDGYFLTEPPAATFARGAQAKVPLLVGSNSQEGYYPAILKDQPPTPENYRAALQKLFGDQAAKALALYPGNSAAEVKASATALVGDMFIAHSTWRWMDLQHRTGKAPVYYYYFAQPRPAKRAPAQGEKPDDGAVHSGEIEFALGNLDGNAVYAWTPADRQVSQVMEGYFAHFIKTGNPNGNGLPRWPAVRERDGGVRRQTSVSLTHSEVEHGAARQAFLQGWFARHQDNPL